MLGSSGLVERERELEALANAIAGVRAGQGAALLVSAPPGLGKTALIGAACRAARQTQLNVLRATAGPGDPSYAVVRELFASVMADPGDELLSGAAGPAAAILDPERGPAADAFAVVHALYWVLARLAERAPVVVAIDDAHWADPATVRWIAFVLSRIDDLPALLLLAGRPQELGERQDLTAALGARPDLIRVAPRPLSRAAVRSLVPGPAADRIASMTAGNPLLVRVVDGALRNGELTAEDLDPERLAEVDAARLRDLVDARIGRLGDEAVALADAVAVLGDGTTLRDAAAVARLAPERAAAARDALVGADVLAGGPGLRFVHPLLRGAVLQHLRPAERSLLHGRAAAQLTSVGARREQVARHLLPVDPAGSPEVVSLLCDGARDAAATGAPEAAIELLERALAEPPDRQERAQVLAALAEAGFTAGHPGTTAWAREAIAAATDPVERARTAIRMAQIIRFQGKVGEGFGDLMPAATELDPLDRDLALQVRAGICAAAVATPSRRAGSLDVLEQLESTTLEGTRPGERAAAAILALEHVARNRPAEAVRRLAQLALGQGDLPLEAFPMWYATVALVHAGGVEEGARHLDAAVAAARRRGSLVGLELATLHRAYTRLLLGDLHGAESDVLESLDSGRPEGWAIGHAAKVGYAIRILLQRGDLVGAAALRDSWEESDRSLPWYGGDAELTWYEVYYLEGRGRFELWSGAADDALATFRTIQRALPRDWTGGAIFTWRTGAARSLLALGRRDEALALADAESEAAAAFGAERVRAGADRLVGVCLGGDDGVDRLRSAIKGLDAAGAPLDAAWARFDLGVTLRRLHHVVDARQPLAEAREWAGRAGARLLHDRATEELLAAGARPRREALRGVDALTGRERRIAELAASGLSNPEIAQHLFITRKTVEAHLAQVYRKLDISSRHQLGAELADR